MKAPRGITSIVPSPRQIHAARVALDMTQHDLADAAQVGIATVKRLEFNRRDMDLSRAMNLDSLSKIVAALEDAGVEFIYEEGRRGITFKG